LRLGAYLSSEGARTGLSDVPRAEPSTEKACKYVRADPSVVIQRIAS